ncbi:hypothetical protein FB567DRAFT_531744 [Paraphoma chrysanthemicola]|uniref:2EXR domain-containing protein n=1 Tax=Paraphoma chrysanthemicola TaxID=798071 RepID=A0A8K0VWE0_9PLEO|nr:hypothetical protein FB567DRAFT_531744 [Paraphoma chrysanthemicola]
MQQEAMATFPPFSRLPLELRMQIWEMSVEKDRIVRVKEKWRPRTGYWSPTQVPAVTRACQESRKYCSYKKAFAVDGFPRYIWVNPTSDIIQMNSSIVLDLVKGDCLERQEIRHLRLELGSAHGLDESDSFYHDYSGKIRNFQKLQRCDILVHDSLYGWGFFIDETYWGACPKENVRLIDSKTGEWIDAKTTRPYLDYHDTNGGKLKDFARIPIYHVEEWEEEEEYAERWAEMMEVGTNPLPRIDLNY